MKQVDNNMEIIKHFKRGSGDRIITRNVFVYAIRNAIRISKCAYPTAKKVISKRGRRGGDLGNGN